MTSTEWDTLREEAERAIRRLAHTFLEKEQQWCWCCPHLDIQRYPEHSPTCEKTRKVLERLMT